MAQDAVKEDELGRSKNAATPREHLQHLLNIGWDPRSPLIYKYITQHGLQRDLEELVRALK
jgi:hypothetical protein